MSESVACMLEYMDNEKTKQRRLIDHFFDYMNVKSPAFSARYTNPSKGIQPDVVSGEFEPQSYSWRRSTGFSKIDFQSISS